uniref:Teneurin-like YD-shell domain-containing protein n=1 Tax=Psilocybe cubensis TaxID=181762 RepID=A0A8H7YBU0_PSICU
MSIYGTLPLNHDVDASGSLSLTVPFSIPESQFKPTLSAFYHSANSKVSTLGKGWTLMGISTVERTPATVAQDGARGVVGYNDKDCFTLDGQRLIKIGDTQENKTEYRFEIEQWTRVFAIGDNLANPTSWEQHLPDGTIRMFGSTEDSNVKADGHKDGYTRVWSINEASDPFTNYITFEYTKPSNGTVYPKRISYGGNRKLSISHRKRVAFTHEKRDDKITEYLGGYKIQTEKRLKEIRCIIGEAPTWEPPKWKYQFDYDYAPLTGVSRIRVLTLVDSLQDLKVEPLKFDWSDGNPVVFDSSKDVSTFSREGIIDAFHIDVNAQGFSDMVIASERKNPDNEDAPELYLDIYLSDSQGKVSETPTKGSGFTGLSNPQSLLAIDADGDGKADLLHIVSSASAYVITILLSNEDATDADNKFNKYEKQQSTTFTPEIMGGSFHAGDFEGNGKIGLVYIYLTTQESSPDVQQVHFVQFTSDGKALTAKDVAKGPSSASITSKDIHVVVGDLDGNGTDDIFILAPATSTPEDGWMIYFLQSNNGTLSYREDDPLKDAGKSVPRVSNPNIFPFKADSDGKTGLLFASATSDKFLKLQLLRSIGNSALLPGEPIATQAKYSDQVTVATLIQRMAEVVNIGGEDDNKVLSVFKFDGENFQQIPNVTQPADFGVLYVRCADLRGIGRSDLLFYSPGDEGRVIARVLPCSGSQPLDNITTFRNGLGGYTTVSYGPLTDPALYTASDIKYCRVTAQMNGTANNSTFSMTSGTAGCQPTESSRSNLVYFPSFVVRDISSKYDTDNPVTVNQFSYTYSNAEISFDGRGWLGFQTITKSDGISKILELTEYYQSFPCTGRVKLSQKRDSEDIAHIVDLGKSEYTWTSKQVNNEKNYTIQLDAVKETYYEAGVQAYDVDVAYTYDDYDNTLSTTITPSQPNASVLSIESTYDAPNSNARWVVGNKRTEDTKQADNFLRRLTQSYTTDTFACKERSHWVREDIWSTTNYTFDDAGYQKEITGPSSSRQEFAYNSTYTTVTTKTHTGTKTTTDESSDEPVTVPITLDEITEYDPATLLPLMVEKPNGVVTKFQYDVLGRKVAISQGPGKDSVSTVETTSFAMDGSKFIETRQISNGLAGTDAAMRKEISYYDGFMRSLSVRKSRPDRLDEYICVDTGYDSLNRKVSRSREYLSTSEPPALDQQFQYTYDKNSRLITEVYPANKSGGQSVTHNLKYSCEAGVPKITETLSVTSSDGGSAADTGSISRELAVIPNADDPSVGNFVKLCVAKRQNENLQTVDTVYDGVARPIEVTDSSSRVKLLLKYDGLSRQVEREIVQLAKPPGDGEKDSDVTFSHFRLTFDDTNLSSTLLNVLTGSSITSKTDFSRRLIEKSTTDETITFDYDADTLSKGRLSSVKSNQGIEHSFLYDNRGNHSSTTLKIDGHELQTTFTWTETGQLKTTNNPDGTSILQEYYPDGLTAKTISLSKGDAVKASVNFSGLENAFGLPLTRLFGNKITSTITVSDSGMLSADTLTLADTEKPLLEQQWDYDPFNKVATGKIGDNNLAYEYDKAGQLSQSIIGNITTVYQDGLCLSATNDSKSTKFTNNVDGWQLKSVFADDDSPLYEYTYSTDGKTSTKKAGDETTTLNYDAQDRLTAIVGSYTGFIYDYAGRLLKATAATGESILYVNPGCEMKVKTGATPDTTTTTWTSYLIDKERRASYTEDQPVDDAPASGVVYYFHTDQLGSTVAVSDNAGTLVTQYRYDALGKATVSGDDLARYKYCGREQFGTLYNFGARFYDFEASFNSSTGRFMTLDNHPLDIDNISPGSFNLYGFSQNDPINFTDLNGNRAVPTAHWIIDGLLIAAGLGLTIASMITLNPLLAVAGGAVLNSGLSGFVTDVAASVDNSSDTGSWLFQLGLGAVIGGVFGGASIGLNLGIRHGTKALLSAGSRQIFKHAVIQNSFNILAEAGLGAAGGAVQQGLTNLYQGDPIGKDVGWSATLGAIAGLVVAGGLMVGQSKWGRVALAGQRASDRILSSARTGLPNLRMQLAQGRFVNSSVVRDAPIEIYYISRGIHFTDIDG